MGMMHVMRSGGALKPCHPEDAELLSKMKESQPYRLEYTQTRSLPHMRKFGALLGMVSEHHPVYSTRAKALIAIKLAAGHCEWVPSPETGELLPIPKSISFARMGQDEFDRFYFDAVNAVITHLLPDMTSGMVDREIAARLEEAVYLF